MLFKLAIRNIKRHKRKSLVIFLIVAAVSLLMFLLLNFVSGQISNLERSILTFLNPKYSFSFASISQYEIDSSDIPVWEHYVKSNDIYPVLDQMDLDYFPLRPSLYFDLITDQTSSYITLLAYDNDRNHYLDLIDILEGQAPDTRSPGILLHREQARAMGLKTGDTCSVIGTDLFGQQIRLDVDITGTYKGVVDTTHIFYHAFLDVGSYENAAGLLAGEVRAIAIKSDIDMAEFEKRITNAFPENSNAFWERPDRTRGSGVVEIFYTVEFLLQAITFLILIIVGYSLVSIISNNILDRRREVATYYCLGTSRIYLVTVYTLELLILVITAVLTGLLVGSGITLIVNILEFKTSNPMVMMVLGGDVLHLRISPFNIFFILSTVTLITLLSSFVSLIKTLNVSPIEAIKET